MGIDIWLFPHLMCRQQDGFTGWSPLMRAGPLGRLLQVMGQSSFLKDVLPIVHLSTETLSHMPLCSWSVNFALAMGWDLSVCGLTLYPLSTCLSRDVY